MRKILKITLILFSALIVIGALYPWVHEEDYTKSELKISGIGSVESVEINILVDNNPNFDLKSPWGISIYIRTQNLSILFDAGPDPNALKENSKKLNLDLSDLDLAVISHEHGDHIRGLEYISEVNRNLTIFVPAHMSESCKNWIKSLGFKVIGVKDTTLISEGIAVVGELYGPPYEQALAINVKNLGLIVLVGCSHPGVDKIVSKAEEDLSQNPYAVIGGFHLSGASLNKIRDIAKALIEMGLKRIYPIHCSGEDLREFLRENYPEVYGDGRVGLKISFSGNQTEVGGG